MSRQLDLLAVTDVDRPVILRAIYDAAKANGGLVSANDWREALRDSCNPKHVGLVVAHLRRSGVLVALPDPIRSTDEIGGNRGRWIDRYRCDLTALSSAMAAAA